MSAFQSAGADFHFRRSGEPLHPEREALQTLVEPKRTEESSPQYWSSDATTFARRSSRPCSAPCERLFGRTAPTPHLSLLADPHGHRQCSIQPVDKHAEFPEI